MFLADRVEYSKCLWLILANKQDKEEAWPVVHILDQINAAVILKDKNGRFKAALKKSKMELKKALIGL